MKDLALKERQQLSKDNQIVVLGQKFEVIQTGSWDKAAHRTIKFPEGEVYIHLDLEHDTPPGETNIKHVIQTFADFDMTDSLLDTGDDHADFVARAMGITSRMPHVGLAVQRIDDHTKLHLTQSVHLGKGDMHWQEFDIEFDTNGVVVNGYGSAEVSNDSVFPRTGEQADLFDVTPTYASNGYNFVKVEFGKGAMAKLLKKFGLPTNYQQGTKALDDFGKPLAFETIAPKIISLTTQKIDVKSLLESGQ